MGRIPEEVIHDVLERADMLQIIGEYVQLRRAGVHYKGLCPFHGEKTPSFHVSPDKGFFKCFGCGEGGTLYSFLMKIEGWSFPEAVRHVAARVGIEIVDEERTEDAQQRRSQKDAYLRVMRLAQGWLEGQLWGAGGAEARAYLRERGVGEEAARAFGLGWAPQEWEALWGHLQGEGVTPAEALMAGLIIESPRGGWYDRFRGRVMFPVRDIWGEVLAFSGRVLVEDPARPGGKYINSPETPFYTKGRELFGLHATRGGIKKADAALMVEGNFDVVTLYAQGVESAVAPLGTALTSRQVKLLSRYTRRVYVAFDADKAGQAATMKALPALLEHGMDARVVQLPAGDDPDSYVRREGGAGLQERLERATPIVAWALDRVLEGREGGPIEERVAALGEVASVLEHVRDKIAWDHYTREVARRLEIEPRKIAGYLKRPERLAEQHAAPAEEAAPAAVEVGEAAEGVIPQRVAPQALRPFERTMLMLLSDASMKLREFVEHGCCNLLADERLESLLLRVHEQAHLTGKEPEYARSAEVLAAELGDRDFLDQVVGALCAERPWTAESLEQTYFDLVMRLQLEWLEQEEVEARRAAEEAARGGGDLLEAARRLQELHKARRELDALLQKKVKKRQAESPRGASTRRALPSEAAEEADAEPF